MPEHLWSCADVQISGYGKDVGTVMTVKIPINAMERIKGERLKFNAKKCFDLFVFGGVWAFGNSTALQGLLEQISSWKYP